MASAVLRFDLPEDAAEFRAATLAMRFASALQAIDQHCRSEIKHGNLSGDAKEMLQEVRDLIPWEAVEL